MRLSIAVPCFNQEATQPGLIIKAQWTVMATDAARKDLPAQAAK